MVGTAFHVNLAMQLDSAVIFLPNLAIKCVARALATKQPTLPTCQQIIVVLLRSSNSDKRGTSTCSITSSSHA
jgi:hypothetical protein